MAKKTMPSDAEVSWLRAQLEEIDETLSLIQHSPWHFQIRQGKEVLADWWPSKGTTMAKQSHGRTCSTVQELLSWLQQAVL